ncbi:alpha/beta fold hydrolase [Geopseudomonas guangdongensis]|uniref:Pimeloyl-ACP methyl ester carboxylesterase n=1 Tax=Geopseudomonas guangdongensis TaxID=1245526 RepID=A0A1H2IC58_9GAMM|nr:alpha/beta hydrolase [Pseudomonas guangdongensis]SDU41709.1 Pimeloyl-ACP methyl ester carboxylesterase [Pseudomonas guangdongensis]
MKSVVWPLAEGVLHGVEQGEGVPVLLVHGSLCDYRYWQAQMAPLAGAGWRVIAVSLRRCYPERWDGQGDGFSSERHVADLVELIDEHLREPVHLVGHSRGGNLALRLAAQRPDLLRSLVLADPGGDYAVELFQASGLEAPLAPARRNLFREEALRLIRVGELEAGMQLFVDTVSGAGIWQRSSARFRQMALDNAFTLVGQVRDRPGVIGADLLHGIRRPTLLLGGERSPAPFPQVLRMLARQLPDARCEILPGVSHGMNVQRPAQFNRLLREFIEAL